jgi:putative ABC transport system permease protein
MPTELMSHLSSDVVIGVVQVGVASVLCLGVVLLCRRFAVHVERETVISLARGLVQMALISVVLTLLIHGDLMVGALILLGMTVAAAVTASRRATGFNDALLLTFYATAAGSGIAIVAMLVTGVLKTDITTLVPIGSVIIANAMNACAQSIERFRSDVTAHVGQIEAALALGADPAVTVAPYVQSAVYASLLPRLDMLSHWVSSGCRA